MTGVSLFSVGIFTLILWLALYLLRREVQLWPVTLLLLADSFWIGAEIIIYGDWVTGGLAFLSIKLMMAYVLGSWLAWRDAANKGEAFWPDVTRSFDYAILLAVLFGGQVILMMGLETSPNERLLLLSVIASALAVQIFAHPLQNAFDQWLLARFPLLRQARVEMRAVDDALPRLDASLNFATMDETEYIKLTRRALSSLGDLPKLAASPLTYLPIVEARLSERGIQPNTLARANELKLVLMSAITHLRPNQNGAGYGISDEWRHFNALYYPYVLGLKPYSVRLDIGDLDDGQRAVLEWFRTQVPERTLHNWQNAAAKLVAQALREQQSIGTNGIIKPQS